MAVDKFRFVSPGIFTAEIDDSRLPAVAPAIGPVVIGRTQYGPAMRPVRITSVQEFERVFGTPHNGKGGGAGDTWREGSKKAPTYAAYAAKAYLRNNNPVTVVRVLGTQHKDATSTGKAGWNVPNASSTGSVTAQAGAFGIFVAGWNGLTGASGALTVITNSKGETVTSGSALAAVLYVTGASVALEGDPVNSGAYANPVAAAFVKGGGANGQEFIAVITSSAGAEKIKFNFTSTDSKFIRKVFNTDATLTNTLVTPSANQENYFLGETFEGFVKEVAGTGSYVAFVAKLPNQSDFRYSNQEASTGWIVSQDTGPSSSFVANSAGEYPLQKLFRFKTLGGGSWEQSNLKISIENVRQSSNPTEIPYGTFDVVVRSLFETNNSVALERFQGVDLNPSSPNFIAKAIGDRYTTWDYDQERYIEYGDFPNNSPNIRVEVDEAVKRGAIPGSLLPFGFYGPPRLKSIALTKNSASTSTQLEGTGSIPLMPTAAGDAGEIVFGLSGAASTTVYFPSISLKNDSGATTLSRFRFGVLAGKKENSDLKDILGAQNSTLQALGTVADGTNTEVSAFVSLDDVITVSPFVSAAWAVGNRNAGTSFTATQATPIDVLKYVNSFDVPLYGGFDGNNIKEPEPIINNRIAGGAGATATTNCAFNTIDVALKTVADAEVLDMNVLAVPGITVPTLTNKMVEICENRGDALAIIDIESDFKPAHEGTAEVKPVVSTAVETFKARQINSSYGCAFYPAVFEVTEGIFLPASVAALGTFGGTERSTAVWFAPAGFNRGGLNTANSGIGVSRTAQHLTARERDELYQVNINPIATFPAEGVVIFGQKTLQTVPSALDRINVRRLMIFVKKQISRFATQVLFDPNTEVTWNRFKSLVEPFLETVKSGFGLEDFRVVLDETTTTPDLVDRNVLYAKILLKPTRAIEFIALDFVIKNTGASFDD